MHEKINIQVRMKCENVCRECLTSNAIFSKNQLSFSVCNLFFFTVFFLLRSAIVIMAGCPTCRQKEPIPSKKIYTERTIELGVFIDPPLYNRMSVSFIENSETYCKTENSLWNHFCKAQTNQNPS